MEILVDDANKVPVFRADEVIGSKFNNISKHFKGKFNHLPSFFVQMPGRVNIIGEHVDYCGYSVCPMAIEQHILIAVSATLEQEIHLTNLDSSYKDFHCNFSDIDKCINNGSPQWHEYFLCGVKGALEVIPKERNLSGLKVAVWGNIPANSGLSSSSALVSAALLATVQANKFQSSKEELATLAAKAERYIGTQGGGMDQAIAFLGNAGSAKFIEFNPLRASDVILPANAVFVIAHSLVFHNKAATSDFNLRVTECRLAAQIMAKKKNVDWESVKKLLDVEKKIGGETRDMIKIVENLLHEEPYTLDEVCDILETSREHLTQASMINPANVGKLFKLHQRALHVFQEACRVTRFRQICDAENGDAELKLQKLGELMSGSHESLQVLYECSHSQVDALVKSAITCGALGARLTGAGWGGCVVTLVHKDNASEFVDKLKKIYYVNNTGDHVDLNSLVFITRPSQGASIYLSNDLL